MIKKIAVLTSGGDAPGMNAAIRAVTRAALDQDWEVMGVKHGYLGLMKGDFTPYTARSVGGIMQNGGTILGSARSEEFRTEAGRAKAIDNMRKAGIDGLVVIGGNGSQTGAHALWEMGFPTNGVASTIDNDLEGSDITIGVDTALNISVEAIDRLKVTASSHSRAFLIEVMGRGSGYLALMSAIAGGAEAAVIPEVETTPEQVVEIIHKTYALEKAHCIIVVAEGAKYELTALMEYCKPRKKELGFELRGTELGHIQRGGMPTAYDRILATRLGNCAVEAMAGGQYGVLAGLRGTDMVTTPLKDIVGKTKRLSDKMIKLANVMAK